MPEGSLVVFSAHGVAPEVHEQAAARSLRTIDATCPLVTKVHHEARRFARDDYDILLIGHEGHEEVVGTSGEAPEHIHLVDGPDAVDAVDVRDPDKVVWLSQTTLSVDETMQTVDALRARFPMLQSPPSDDICYATQNRQAAVKIDRARRRAVPRRRLGELVELGTDGRGGRGCRRPYRPPGRERRRDRRALARRRQRRWACPRVRPCPDVLVQDVVAWLAERGFGDLQEVSHTEERLTFALPQELRRALGSTQRSRDA